MASIGFRLKSYFKWALSKLGIYKYLKFQIGVIAAKRIYKKENAAAYLKEDAENVVWMYYPTPHVYNRRRAFDILLCASLAHSKANFQIYEGPEIGKFKGKNILFNVHTEKLNVFGFENYSANYQHVCKQLEEQHNNVFPSYHDVLYWENKVYMHEKFEELGIRSPRTTVYTDFAEVIKKEHEFPFLIKVPHSSGSFGLFNVTSADYLQSIASDPIIVSNSEYIVQQRLNITQDLRVILVGDKIIHSYWRINKDKTKWKTTATSGGSYVDFGNFPEKWRQYIIDTFKKLGLVTGAFDIGWQNDDLETEPYIFEVSPSYDVNPAVTIPEHLNDYGKYKKRILFKNSFDRLFVEGTYEAKEPSVALFLEQVKNKKKK